MTYDILIVGCGPAGMTAAIYAARAGKTVLLLDKEGIGGQIAKSPKVENFPGFCSGSGLDLATSMFEQVSVLPNIQFDLAEVTKIIAPSESEETGFQFFTDYEPETPTHAKAVIIAAGAKPVQLGVEGEVEYIGAGVYYCAVCDGPLFEGRDVLVIGSGNSGAQYALEMAQYCRRVVICDITPTYCCEPMLRTRLEESTNVESYFGLKINKIQKLESGAMLASFQDGETIVTDGIFVAIGQKPDTENFKNLVRVNDRNYIIGNEALQTSMPGIFVAGDCRVKNIRQAVAAASDGAEAAINAIKYLNTLGG